MVMGVVLLLVASVGTVHIRKYRLAVNSLVERLRGARTVRVFCCIFLVNLRFFFRALGRALPVAAELVVDQIEVRQIGPARARIELDDLS